jgi:hypothetical protein
MMKQPTAASMAHLRSMAHDHNSTNRSLGKGGTDASCIRHLCKLPLMKQPTAASMAHLQAHNSTTECMSTRLYIAAVRCTQ